MKTASWVAVIVGSVIGGLVFVVGLATAEGAPQQAATAGMALAVVVLPYGFARAVGKLSVTPLASEKACPFCAESVRREARKCRYCGSELAVTAPSDAPSDAICQVCSRPANDHQPWCSQLRQF